MNNREIFDFVSDVGVEMIKNGGEIPRAVMTMQEIAKAFNIRNYDVYAIANGIFASGIMGNEENYICKIRNVSLSSTNLAKVDAINSLSRNIAEGGVNPEQAKERLEKIKIMKEYSTLITTIAMGIGNGAFCYIFKGNLEDCFYTFIVGMFLNLFINFISKKFKMPKIMNNTIFAMFVTIFCCGLTYFNMGDNLGSMITASIMPLVPGIPFTNAIRDLVNDDYLSGVIRLSDAFLVGLSVGCGVGIVILCYNIMIGGIAL